MAASLWNEMKRTSKAKAAQLLFLAAAVQRDWQLAVPVAEQAGWDVLVRMEAGWRSVQIKAAYLSKRDLDKYAAKRFYVDTMKGGGYGNQRTTASRKYVEGDFDYLAAVDVETRQIWFIDAGYAIGKRALRLRDEWAF